MMVDRAGRVAGLERIGHGGASALERANSLASFDAARAIGVDYIEFDVRAWRGDLVLAHTIMHARRAGNLRLRDALAHLSTPDFASIGLHLDVKHEGCEAAILGELCHAGLLERSLLCSQIPAVLDRFRALCPHVQVAISVGGRMARATHRWGDWRRAAVAGLATRRWNALMVQHKLVDADLIAAVSGQDSRLYAWTVNERSLIESLRRLGVHGITTADPRLFA
jgi:glycerophosphoryl diester phosphodiesterase